MAKMGRGRFTCFARAQEGKVIWQRFGADSDGPPWRHSRTNIQMGVVFPIHISSDSTDPNGVTNRRRGRGRKVVEGGEANVIREPGYRRKIIRAGSAGRPYANFRYSNKWRLGDIIERRWDEENGRRPIRTSMGRDTNVLITGDFAYATTSR